MRLLYSHACLHGKTYILYIIILYYVYNTCIPGQLNSQNLTNQLGHLAAKHLPTGVAMQYTHRMGLLMFSYWRLAASSWQFRQSICMYTL